MTRLARVSMTHDQLNRWARACNTMAELADAAGRFEDANEYRTDGIIALAHRNMIEVREEAA